MCRRLTVCTLACVCAKGGLTSGCMLGKTTFFVANQANLEDMPAEKLKGLEAEHKAIEEANKVLATDLKAANAGARPCRCIIFAEQRRATEVLVRLRTTPTDAELGAQLHDVTEKVRSSPFARPRVL